MHNVHYTVCKQLHAEHGENRSHQARDDAQAAFPNQGDQSLIEDEGDKCDHADDYSSPCLLGLERLRVLGNGDAVVAGEVVLDLNFTVSELFKAKSDGFPLIVAEFEE